MWSISISVPVLCAYSSPHILLLVSMRGRRLTQNSLSNVHYCGGFPYRAAGARPNPSSSHVAEVPYFAGRFSTPRGTISTAWRWVQHSTKGPHTAGTYSSSDVDGWKKDWNCRCPHFAELTLSLNVSIPANVEAEVFFPSLSSSPSYVCVDGSTQPSAMFTDLVLGSAHGDGHTYRAQYGGTRPSVKVRSGDWRFEICA